MANTTRIVAGVAASAIPFTAAFMMLWALARKRSGIRQGGVFAKTKGGDAGIYFGALGVAAAATALVAMPLEVAITTSGDNNETETETITNSSGKTTTVTVPN